MRHSFAPVGVAFAAFTSPAKGVIVYAVLYEELSYVLRAARLDEMSYIILRINITCQTTSQFCIAISQDI